MSALRDDRDRHDDRPGNGLRPSVFEGSVADLGDMFRGGESLSNLRSLDEREQGGEGSVGRSVALSQVSMPAELGGGDWTKTLTMVERAAATIRAYEKRFLQLEK